MLAKMTQEVTMTERRYNDDYEDAFDERGILRDGRRVRVPMQFMDSMQRAVRERFGSGPSIADSHILVVDAFGKPAGHRPGPCYLRIPEHMTDHAIAAAQDHNRAQAYADFVASLQDAWKGDSNSREVARLHDTGDPINDAYLDQISDLENAWAKGSGRR
jgi:hypothetical protein